MNVQPKSRPVLRADSEVSQLGPAGVTVSSLESGLMDAIDQAGQEAGTSLQDLLKVTVFQPGHPSIEPVPEIAGRYQVLNSGLRFVPYFPFEPGVSYRATFHPQLLDSSKAAEPLTCDFSYTAPPVLPRVSVQQVYPTSDCMPENLLRFYIVFSGPMQRGCSEQQIRLLGPDGVPAPDVLYRPPVELWDRDMRTLTILLDPGRLKRGVGPNSELGPPLKAGIRYTLVVGSGMLDDNGRPLIAPLYKLFQVEEPVRQPIAVEQWRVELPATQSREPLVLSFPQQLDWALLANSIAITHVGAQEVAGEVMIDKHETRWSFTPLSDWSAGSYEVVVHPDLEDVCGNSILGAFDKPIRGGIDLQYEEATKQISFHLA
jgi:hypothetical protein